MMKKMHRAWLVPVALGLITAVGCEDGYQSPSSTPSTTTSPPATQATEPAADTTGSTDVNINVDGDGGNRVADGSRARPLREGLRDAVRDADVDVSVDDGRVDIDAGK